MIRTALPRSEATRQAIKGVAGEMGKHRDPWKGFALELQEIGNSTGELDLCRKGDVTMAFDGNSSCYVVHLPLVLPPFTFNHH